MPSARSARNTFSFAPGLSAVAAADHLHVARPRAGALDLEVALVVAAAVGVVVVARDRDQVLGVRAVALELVASWCRAPRAWYSSPRAVAVVVGHRAARLLLVDARQHQDPGAVASPRSPPPGCGGTCSARSSARFLPARRACDLAPSRARDLRGCSFRGVGLADHQRRARCVRVLRHLARACGSGSTTSALGVTEGRRRDRGSPARSSASGAVNQRTAHSPTTHRAVSPPMRRLCGRHARDRHAVRRAADVVEPGELEEARSSRGRRRARRRRRASGPGLASRPIHAASRTSQPTPGRSIVSNGLRSTIFFSM